MRSRMSSRNLAVAPFSNGGMARITMPKAEFAHLSPRGSHAPPADCRHSLAIVGAGPIDMDQSFVAGPSEVASSVWFDLHPSRRVVLASDRGSGRGPLTLVPKADRAPAAARRGEPPRHGRPCGDPLGPHGSSISDRDQRDKPAVTCREGLDPGRASSHIEMDQARPRRAVALSRSG
jgi:hypothetical protein